MKYTRLLSKDTVYALNGTGYIFKKCFDVELFHVFYSKYEFMSNEAARINNVKEILKLLKPFCDKISRGLRSLSPSVRSVLLKK